MFSEARPCQQTIIIPNQSALKRTSAECAFAVKKWKGLIFLRSYLHPHLDRANYKKVQISSLRKQSLVNMTWRKTWNVLGTSWQTACQKVPRAMMIHSAKVTYIKTVTCPSDQLPFDQHQTVDWPPKRNTFHSKLKHLGMSIYLTIISNHFHLNISKIILSKRVMSFNKTHNRQLFSKPQNIL